jgi:hypothetical protein
MDMSNRDHLRRREDDDDLFLLILPSLHLLGYLGCSKKKLRHTSALTRKEKVRELLEGHIKNYRVSFRMLSYIFKSLANYLRMEGLVKDTRIKVEEKLGFFLYMISHNATFEDLQFFFGHSNGTFHHVIKHFFNIVIPGLSMWFLKPPSNQVHPKIHEDNRFYPYFKVTSFNSYVSILEHPQYYILLDRFFFAEFHRFNRWNPCSSINVTRSSRTIQE